MRFSPTTTVCHPDTPLHLKALTDELTALHGELYWLAMQAEDLAAKESPAAHLNVELLAALKSATDNLRLLLWKYIEAASEIDPQTVQDELEVQRVQRITQFLQVLRNRLGRSSDQGPLSFIERVSKEMKERFADKVAESSRRI